MLLLFLISPLREVTDVQLTIPTHQHDIFCNYSNDNFTQEVFYDAVKDRMTAHIKNSNFFALNLNFRIFPDTKFIASLSPTMRETVRNLLDNSITFKSYFKKISFFLEGHIEYSQENLPQNALSVILNKKASCVGYSNVVRVLLNAAGIKNTIVKGFYLKKDPKRRRENLLIPIPHRWVEIYLPNGVKFFYDPQHQEFSFNYLATKIGIDFKQVKKFKVNIIKKSKKMINQ
jgi:transglutaminase-like putative cysteine protease